MAKYDAEFWGTYEEAEGGDFVKEYDYLRYVAEGTVVLATGVREGAGGQYGPQWLLDFTDPSGEEKTKGYKKGITERDSRMERLQKTLAETGEPIEVRFIKVGRRHDVTGA